MDLCLQPYLITCPFIFAAYLDRVDKWFTVLLTTVKPFLYENGGPVVMVQVIIKKCVVLIQHKFKFSFSYKSNNTFELCALKKATCNN